MKKIVFLLILTSFLPLAAQAQLYSPDLGIYNPQSISGQSNTDTTIQTEGNRYWVNTGLGVGTNGMALIAGTHYQFGPNLLSFRGCVTTEVLGDEFWDIGLLYGWASSEYDYHISFSSGIAVMGGSRSEGGLFSDTPREVISAQFGVPLEGQLFWRPSGNFGLGLYGFANLNTEQSFGGLALSVQLGKLR